MQGATLNLIHAYRNLPLSLLHKSYVASMWHDNIYLDHCTMEGLSSSVYIQGILVDTLVSILKHHGVNKVLKWVNDFCLFRIPTPHAPAGIATSSQHYSIDISSIFVITDPLGVPCHPINVKGQDFSPIVSYFVFFCGIYRNVQSLLMKKCLEYLDKIKMFQSLVKSTVSCKDEMSIHRMLQHITYVYRQGQCSLPPFLAFIAKFPNDFTHHHVPKSVLESLAWWNAILQNPYNSHSLLPHAAVNLNIWVDASTSWGIGVILGQHWAARQLICGWRSNGCNIGWEESIKLELAILWLIQDGYVDCNIIICGTTWV